MLLTLTSSPSVGSYKILALFTFPGKSHFEVFKPLLGQLVVRGHEVTLVSPHCLDVNATSYRHVDLRDAYEPLVSVVGFEEGTHDLWGKLGEPVAISTMGTQVCQASLNHESVRNLLASGANNKFDLILLELFNSVCDVAYTKHFHSPFIGLTSHIPMSWTHSLVGNPNNPAYSASMLSFGSDDMTFDERVENVILTVWALVVHWYHSTVVLDPIARERFGQDLPSLGRMANNVSLVLAYAHFSVTRPKPAVPALIDVLGMHVGKPKQLPEVIRTAPLHCCTVNNALAPALFTVIGWRWKSPGNNKSETFINSESA